MNRDAVLRAGASRVDITPPVGVEMVGFAARGPNTGQHDPLTATALVLAAGRRRAAIVACDLCFIGAEQADAIAARVRQRCRIPPDNVLVCCSHTHYGPAMRPSGDGRADALLRLYHEHLILKISGAVEEACSRLAPVRVAAARGRCDANVNRRERLPDGRIVLGRNPEGPVDREVLVVRLDAVDGAPMAVLVNYACHAVCLGSQWTLFSADFLGAMREVVEGVVRAPVLFLQGACGNINPPQLVRDYDSAFRTGARLAGETLKLWASVESEAACGLDAAAARLSYPAFRGLSLEDAAARLERSRARLEDARRRGARRTLLRWLQRNVERDEAAVRFWREGVEPPPVEGRVHAVRFGPVALVAASGEVFCEIGMDIKRRAPQPFTMFAGYTNADIMYIPVPDAYAEGGYEVDMACRVDASAAGMLTSTALDLLGRVCP